MGQGYGVKVIKLTTGDLNYKFNAKELDAESGLYYYGARYYDPRISVWLSVDPMWEDRSWVSGYNYCQNNPYIRTDPSGALDDIYITGEAAEEATRQLQKSTSLQLRRDTQTGKITATGKAKTKSDRQLLSAINDKNIDVNVNASNSLKTSTGNDFSGGAFMGNKITESTLELAIPELKSSMDISFTKVEAFQEVNPNMLEYYDKVTGSIQGTFMKHEVTEAYEGSKISLSKGISALPAIRGNATYNSIYNPAHDSASPQPLLNPSDVGNARRYSQAKPILIQLLNNLIN